MKWNSRRRNRETYTEVTKTRRSQRIQEAKSPKARVFVMRRIRACGAGALGYKLFMPKKLRDDSLNREKLILWVDFSRKALFSARQHQ
jgi:hypothetical protein